MTRTRQNGNSAANVTDAIHGVPPLDMLPADLVKVIEEIRDLHVRQRDALTAVNELQDDASVEAAKAEDRAEHGRQIRAGKKGVIVQDAQQKLAKAIAAAQHELDGLNAAVEGAYIEFRALREKAYEDPALAAKARKSASAALAALDAFHAAYGQYDAQDMLRAWYYGHRYQPVKPFPLQELVTLSRNGDRPDRLQVDLDDLVKNLKAEIIDPRDLEA